MAKDEEKDEEEDEGYTCDKCGTNYADTSDIRRVANRLAKGGKAFRCPDCLAEDAAEIKEAEEEAEEEAEPEAEEEAEEEAPAPKPAPKKKK